MSRALGAGVALGVLLGALPAGALAQEDRDWWSAGDGRTLPAQARYENDHGALGVLNTAGPIDTRGHAFFEAIGANGRACVTCHQPADGMGLSVESVRARWEATDGADPLFAAVDGRDCPHLPAGDAAAHSLMLSRGLVRIPLPWPPRKADGSAIEPEFTLEVVRDPTDCNTHPEYGLEADEPMVSVYRRPRPVANLKYVTAAEFGVGPFSIKDASPAARDPETGALVNMNMMADAREATLKTQAVSASLEHLQTNGPPSPADLAEILGFEQQVYAAQIEHAQAGRLDEPNGPPALGPAALADGRTAVLGNNVTNYVFPMEEAWSALPRTGNATVDARNAFRESVARGHDVFFFRTFWIEGAMARPRGARAVLLERLGRESARARRFLRPAFQHSLFGAGKAGPRQFPEHAMRTHHCTRARSARARRARSAVAHNRAARTIQRNRRRHTMSRSLFAATLAATLLAAAAAETPPENRRNFVSCPIVRDTATVPCWLSEHDGELYYLGIQTDVSADFDPPYLGHRVLVEGTATDERICGGIVLEPVNVSTLPELDATCNQIWPAEDKYTVPFAPRPPGPSGGRLAFDPPPGAARPAPPPIDPNVPREFVVHYDFDMLIMGRHAPVLGRILTHAETVESRAITVTGYAGATLLSDGTLMAEPASIARKRAAEIAALLEGAGLDTVEYTLEAGTHEVMADGVDDWRSRRVVVIVEP